MVPINTVPYYDAAELLNISFSSLFQVSTCHRIKGCQARDYLTWQAGEGRSGLSVMTNRHTTILIDKLTRINRSLKIDFLGEAQVSQFTAMLKAIYIIKRGFSPKCLMIGGIDSRDEVHLHPRAIN